MSMNGILNQISTTFSSAAAECLRVLIVVSVVAGVMSGAAFGSEAESVADYTLELTLDPGERTLEARAEIISGDARAFDLLLDARFEVLALNLDARAVALRPVREGRLLRWRIPAGDADRVVSLQWRGRLAPLPGGMRHPDTLGWREATADLKGSYLPASSFWYPVAARGHEWLRHRYRAKIGLPDGQRGIVAGTLTAETTRDGRTISEFAFSDPAPGIDLIAGPYHGAQRTTRSVDGREIVVRTLFHNEIKALSSDYIESVIDYLALYEEQIGPYPYRSFSVVSSPTPTGLGMPTMTYLGVQVLALPFIRTTSLGHEVLHNWWGNGVYPDYSGGNWSEGLTTFMSDYHYAERESEERAREMRLGWLRELSAIDDGVDQPLVAFTARHHGLAQAIGYSKAAMLFVMLRDRVGEDAFSRGLQRFWREHRFDVAGWDALRGAFEAESGEALDVFFAQWLARRGLPEVELAAAKQTPGGVIIDLVQLDPPYELDVPIRVETSTGTTTHVLRLDQTEKRFELAQSERVQRVSLDPDNRMLRRLGTFETAPILREIQFDRSPAVLVFGDARFRSTAGTLATRILESTPVHHDPALAPGTDALLVIGRHRAIADWLGRHRLPPEPIQVAGLGDVRMWTVRLPSGAALAVISANNTAALEQATRRLPHYRQQSWLVVQQGHALVRGVWPAIVPSIDLASD